MAATWYLLFTGLAWARYPGAYGPWSNNWLSDLGNRNVNPSGAGLYAIGCIGTGVLLAGFFIGMLSWRRSGSKVQDWLLLLTLFAGLIAAVSIVMSAVYSIDQYGAHQFWSRLISGSTAVAFFVTPFALRRHRQRIWPLAAVGAAGYASIVARLVFASAHWLEWPSLGLLLVYVLVVAQMTRNDASDRHPVAGRDHRPTVVPT